MATTISDRDFEDLEGYIEMIDLRLFEHGQRDNASGESLYRAEQEVQKAKQIIARIKQQQ